MDKKDRVIELGMRIAKARLELKQLEIELDNLIGSGGTEARSATKKPRNRQVLPENLNDTILAVFKKLGKPAGAVDVVKAVKVQHPEIKDSALRGRLKELAKQGKIKKKGYGVYAAVNGK